MQTLEEKILERYNELCMEADDLLEKDDNENAVQKFKEALSILPEGRWDCDVYAYAGIGEAYQKLEDYERALEAFENSYIEHQVDNPYILLNLGICFYHLNKIEEAKKFLKLAYSIGGDEVFEDAEEYLKLINDNTEHEEIQKSMMDKENRNSYIELCEKADQLLEEGQVEEAIHQYQYALSILKEKDWDGVVYAFIGIGDAYQELGDYKNSLTAFLACLDTEEKDNPYIIMNIGICFYHLNQIEEAKKFLYIAYEFGGDDVFEGAEEYLELIDK